MICQNSIFIVLLLSYFFTLVDLLSQYPIILIISYDAFSHEFLFKGVTPNLVKLREKSTYADYMNNVFVTKTFPNHHSIATGVYPEFHGVLGNYMYDSLNKKQLNYSYEFWHYDNDIIPIWIANEKKGNGRYSGIMMWPGNEYEYSGVKPTYQKAWSYNVTWQERIDIVIDWIINPEKPANLVLLYIEEPDYHGHSFGVESQKFLDELNLLDNLTQYILNKLAKHNLIDFVNTFFLADHGMISVTLEDVIDLRKIISSDLYDKYETSPVLQIFPKAGQANHVYNSLKKAVDNGAEFNVYKKSEIPDYWHFKNNRRTPPILIVANPPHVFHDFYSHVKDIQKIWNLDVNNSTHFGIHGYDNRNNSMKPYFMAFGPLIKKNHKIDPFDTVDLFSLWAHMLGFPEYAEKTNGSLKIVSQMLINSPRHDNAGLFAGVTTAVIALIAGMTIAVIALLVICIVFYKKWFSNSKLYLFRKSSFFGLLKEVRIRTSTSENSNKTLLNFKIISSLELSH